MLTRLLRGAALALALTGPATAEETAQVDILGDCAVRAPIVSALSVLGKEQRLLAELQGTGLLEFWADEADRSWTLLLTLPTGETCLVGLGASFEMLPAPVPGEDS